MDSLILGLLSAFCSMHVANTANREGWTKAEFGWLAFFVVAAVVNLVKFGETL